MGPFKLKYGKKQFYYFIDLAQTEYFRKMPPDLS